MYNVEFKYGPGQKIFDPAGNIGTIIVCGADISGSLYKVQAGQVVGWYREEELKLSRGTQNMEIKG
jgi:hypothetical protein